MEKVSGVVKRVTYKNDNNGYAVLKITPNRGSEKNLFDVESDKEKTITVTGNLAMIKEGEEVDFLGEWESHSKYGTYLDVKRYQINSPTSVEGLKRFLATDYFKGIGAKTAQLLIDEFGKDLPRIIEEEPSKLATVKGITTEKAQNIHESWILAKAIRDEMISLQAIGLSPSTAQKIIKQYPGEAVKQVRQNPYQLAQDIWGVGFNKADDIARSMGFELEHPFRVKSGIEFALLKALDDGHTYLPYSELLNEATKLLGVNRPIVEKVLDQMVEDDELVSIPIADYQAVYVKRYFEAEKELADRLTDLSSHTESSAQNRSQTDTSIKNVLVEPSEVDSELSVLEKERGFGLAPEQGEAVRMVFSNPVSILTGGPGTGKSTTIDTIVRIANDHDLAVALAAPTGRAAKRMEEISGYPAYTIHRLLRLQPGEIAAYNEDNPLSYDVIIVDEASMLDSFLALYLVRAIKPGAHLLLVGDADQLPSVQAGNVLHDIIRSQRFPVIQLQTIFRQAKESAIIRNAHRIREGLFPELPPHPTDFYLFSIDDVDKVADEIVSLVTERLPKEFRVDAKSDVQVMAPLYKTKAGVTELNTRIQERLNPKSYKKNEVRFGFSVFREGDRVMQLRNNYEKDVYNGDVGRIVGIENKDNTKVLVDFPGKSAPKEYKDEEIKELTLAYAVSVHKSQGSEYPVVVMPVVTSHYIMLQRNLLYTAITRAKKLVILVGSKRAIYIALKNDKPQRRYSGLDRLLLAA